MLLLSIIILIMCLLIEFILINRFYVLTNQKKLKKFKTMIGFIIVLFLVITLIITIIINECYIPNNGYLTLWEAKDVLAFYGSFLSFVGTVVLGAVAIFQNKKANETNERLMELEREALYRENSADIIINNVNVNNNWGVIRLSNELGDYKEYNPLYFCMENAGKAVLKKVTLIFNEKYPFESHIVIANGRNKFVKIQMPKDVKEGDYVKIIYESCYGIKTMGDFKIKANNGNFITKHYHYYGLLKEEETK